MATTEATSEYRQPTLPRGDKIVSLVEVKGKVLLVTEKAVYEMVDGELKPMNFVVKE